MSRVIPSQPSEKQRAALEQLGFESVDTHDSVYACWRGHGIEFAVWFTWEPKDQAEAVAKIVSEARAFQRAETKAKFEAVWR